MPQAKRSTSTRSRFKQPPALKRLSTSLDTAQKALTELSKGGSRDVSKGAGEIYKDLRSFVSNARSESNKVAKALQREFDQAQKQLSKAASGTRSSTGRATSRSTSSRATGSTRSKSSGSTSSRSTSSRSTSARSASPRSAAGRSTAKKATGTGTGRASSGTRRASTGTRRASSKRSGGSKS